MHIRFFSRIQHFMIDMIVKRNFQILSNFQESILIPLNKRGRTDYWRKESNVRIFAGRENRDLMIYRHNYPELISFQIHFNVSMQSERRSSKRINKVLITYVVFVMFAY